MQRYIAKRVRRHVQFKIGTGFKGIQRGQRCEDGVFGRNDVNNGNGIILTCSIHAGVGFVRNGRAAKVVELRAFNSANATHMSSA